MRNVAFLIRLSIYVGTIWCKVVDVMRVVVIKCRKWTEVYDSLRSAQCKATKAAFIFHLGV